MRLPARRAAEEANIFFKLFAAQDREDARILRNQHRAAVRAKKRKQSAREEKKKAALAEAARQAVALEHARSRPQRVRRSAEQVTKNNGNCACVCHENLGCFIQTKQREPAENVHM